MISFDLAICISHWEAWKTDMSTEAITWSKVCCEDETDNGLGYTIIISGTSPMHTDISSLIHGCPKSMVVHAWILNCISLYGMRGWLLLYIHAFKSCKANSICVTSESEYNATSFCGRQDVCASVKAFGGQMTSLREERHGSLEYMGRWTTHRDVLVGLLSGHVVEWMDGKEKRNKVCYLIHYEHNSYWISVGKTPEIQGFITWN